MQIIPAAFGPAIHRPDRIKVCSDACRFHHVTLRSCQHCPFERQQHSRERFYKPNPSRNRPQNIMASPIEIPVPQSADPMAFRPVPHMQMAQTTTDSTTPDWNKLCAQLCRNGTGGLLCKCDLPPF